MPEISRNYVAIMERVRAAQDAAGRRGEAITLLAVSKFQPKGRIEEAARAGLRHFAESRLQEAQEKLPELKGLGEWHFIGNLQTKKAKAVSALFDVIQSVDDLELAERLNEQAFQLGKKQRIYAQVNISAEPQKHGFPLQGSDDSLAKLATLPHLELEGLMGMAAALEDPDLARPSFAALRLLRERLGPPLGRRLKLSMGMSHDFEAAIKEGADLIRIGTALFE